jgi:hypothetical protein
MEKRPHANQEKTQADLKALDETLELVARCNKYPKVKKCFHSGEIFPTNSH